MRTYIRLLACVGTAVASFAIGVSPSSASGTYTRPTITATQATFVIPASPAGTWTLNLWTLPKPSTHVGSVSGTSGTLTLPVPQTANCEFQADVRLTVGGVGKFYSGDIATVQGCGQSGNGTRLTPGYWKTHQTETQALLPQPLGTYQVTTATEATAVLDAMNCSDAVNCVAGHLLAAELDVASGGSICIVGVIYQANKFLTDASYSGPGSYQISAARRAIGIDLANALDNYTNDSTSSSC